MNDIFNLSNDPKATFKMRVFVCQNSKNSPCKPLMVYPFYYMAIYHSWMRHVINKLINLQQDQIGKFF